MNGFTRGLSAAASLFALAFGLALGVTLLAPVRASAQPPILVAPPMADPNEPTISKNELRRALTPVNPHDPNSAANPLSPGDPGNSNGNNVANAKGESSDMRYRWSYSRTDSKTGLPLEIGDEDTRRQEIDEFRLECLKLVSDMDAQNGGSQRVPVSQFSNLEDQWSVMILGCVNKLHIARTRGMRGVGAIMCEAHTGECWGPNNVWTQRPAQVH